MNRKNRSLLLLNLLVVIVIRDSGARFRKTTRELTTIVRFVTLKNHKR